MVKVKQTNKKNKRMENKTQNKLHALIIIIFNTPTKCEQSLVYF